MNDHEEQLVVLASQRRLAGQQVIKAQVGAVGQVGGGRISHVTSLRASGQAAQMTFAAAAQRIVRPKSSNLSAYVGFPGTTSFV